MSEFGGFRDLTSLYGGIYADMPKECIWVSTQICQKNAYGSVISHPKMVNDPAALLYIQSHHCGKSLL